MNIYVSNLGFNVQDKDLSSLFAPYGESRGFGFVEMSDDEAARKAISELDQKSVDGRSIKVVEARPKEDRPRSNGGFDKKRW
jgi:RNA recognition motif-containing protein